MREEIKACVIGLGYVGLPLSIELSKYFKTTGLDISKSRIKNLINQNDSNNLIDNNEKKQLKKIFFSNDFKNIRKNNTIFVCLPTPVKKNKKPDLSLIKKACISIGKNLSKGSIVIFESTFYPGVTEEICIPIIEKFSKMVWKRDFNIGYSPERISPGKNATKIKNISKIISGDNAVGLSKVNYVYSKIIKSKLHLAKNIKTAESAKILENIQRDVNIALMNEISIIFRKLNINIYDVISAASSKWNFQKYYPGLVGGHCIGVDPYYLSYKSQLLGLQPKLILTSRKINEKMILNIIKNLKKFIKNSKINNNKIKILIMGVTYKEDCNDLRNSKIIDLIKVLKKTKFKITYNDILADNKIFKNETNQNLTRFEKLNYQFDYVMLCQPHQFYLKNRKKILSMQKKSGVFFDLKNSFKIKNNKNYNVFTL